MTVAEIRTLLARASAQDPLLAGVFPDPQDRREVTAAWLGVTVERTPSGTRTGPPAAGRCRRPALRR